MPQNQLSTVLILLVLACVQTLIAAAPPKSKAAAPPAEKSGAKSGSKATAKNRGKAGKSGKKSARSPRQSEPTANRYMEIQQALADKGYYSGPVNGVWGPDSVDSLKKFQSAQNLEPDGKLGALSLIALGLGPKREPVSQLAGKPELSQ